MLVHPANQSRCQQPSLINPHGPHPGYERGDGVIVEAYQRQQRKILIHFPHEVAQGPIIEANRKSVLSFGQAHYSTPPTALISHVTSFTFHVSRSPPKCF